MDLGLAGHAAVVVGGAQGIGLAIAEAFAEEGADVALVDRDASVGAAAADVGRRSPVRVESLLVDVADEQEVARLAPEVISRLGRVDHLVFAVGVGSGGHGHPFWNVGAAAWRRVLDVNLVGAAVVGGAFAPILSAQRRGTMLFLASVAGQTGSQTDPPYSASKAGLINFAQCMAKDLAPFDVRVNTICPGSVRTRLHRSVWQAWHDRQPEGKRLGYEEWTSERIAAIPLGRWQEPEDVANLAVFLASPRARNVTGQTLNVDGGLVMHS